jgi:hypothetical protein
MEEIWKDVPNYEGMYQVSNLGRVRSLPRKILRKNGVPQTLQGHVLRPQVCNSSGHLFVQLGHGNKNLVHILVARAFIGENPGGLDVCHNDSNPKNNRVENLRYDTRSNNNIDAVKAGRKKALSAEKVRHIRTLLAEGVEGTAIAKEMGVSVSCIYHIKKGRSFGWLEDAT